MDVSLADVMSFVDFIDVKKLLLVLEPDANYDASSCNTLIYFLYAYVFL